MKKILYLSIITSMIGASVISINMGLFQLSLFRGLILLLSFLMIIEIFLTNKKIPLKIHQKNSYSIKFMFYWFVYAFFTLAWVKDYASWGRAIFFIGIGILSIMVISKYFKNSIDVLNSFRIMFPMIIFHNVLGWYEIITGNYIFLPESRVEIYLRYSHPVSTFGNTNDFAVFLMFSFFVMYICLMNTKKIICKTMYITFMISSIALIITTNSRATLAGLILGIITFVLYSIQKRRTRKIILSIAVVLFFLVVINPKVLLSLFSNIESVLSFNFTQQTGSEFVRLNLLKNGLYFLVLTLGFGTGAGNIEYWMQNYAVYYTGGVLNIHNWWMEILVGYGLMTFILYIVFYIRLFLSMSNKFRKSNNKIDMTISLGIMCVMTGYIVASTTSSSNMSSEWIWVFWSIVITYQGISNTSVITNQKDKRINLANKIMCKKLVQCIVDN